MFSQLFRLSMVLMTFLLVLSLSACERDSAEPKLSLYYQGEAVSHSLSEDVLVINYWAEWCKPCIEEIPELNRFYQAHAKRVLLVGINYDRLQGDALLSEAEKAGIEYPLSQSDLAGIFAYPAVEVLPTTVFIDLKSGVHESLLGPQTLATLEDTFKRFQGD